MAKVVFGLSFELHSEAIVVDVVGGGSGKENTRLFFFWSQWNTGVCISSICVLPWTVMVRCSLSWLLPQVMIHCQVPLCELVTGLSWAVGDHSGESTFGLLHFTSLHNLQWHLSRHTGALPRSPAGDQQREWQRPTLSAGGEDKVRSIKRERRPWWTRDLIQIHYTHEKPHNIRKRRWFTTTKWTHGKLSSSYYN